MIDIGHRVRALREERSWTQTELAKRVGMHQAHLANIENGRKKPSVEMLAKLATALDVTPNDLMTAIAEPTPA